MWGFQAACRFIGYLCGPGMVCEYYNLFSFFDFTKIVNLKFTVDVGICN